MVPYVVASVIILLIKLATQRFMYVENPVTVVDFFTILFLPTAGYFLWALWWMMCLIPLFRTPCSRLWFLLAALILNILSHYAPEIFCLRQTMEFMVYFVAGAVCYDMLHKRGHANFSISSKILSILLFIVMATASLCMPTQE